MRADGTTPESLILIGGGARSAEWAQSVTDVLEVPLCRPVHAQSSAALGAARLAWLASDGNFQDVVHPTPVLDRFLPDI
ncbi:hypothetical protein BTK97_005269 [Burkholderia multivorans]|nr:hypothetical protein [Burkholderia multivorans]